MVVGGFGPRRLVAVSTPGPGLASTPSRVNCGRAVAAYGREDSPVRQWHALRCLQPPGCVG